MAPAALRLTPGAGAGAGQTRTGQLALPAPAHDRTSAILPAFCPTCPHRAVRNRTDPNVNSVSILLSRADAAQTDHPTPASRRCWPSGYPPAPDPAWVRPCRRIDLPRQRRSPAAKHRAGRVQNSWPKSTHSRRIPKLCDCCRYGTSAPLRWRPPTVQARELSTLLNPEVSTLLRPLRSRATCGNGLPHSGSRGFADTEEVTGSNPVAPTTILAGHGVASVEPVPLATWLGRAGAARRPRRQARLISPGPSTLTPGSATTTQSSRSSRPRWPPRTVPCGNLAPATPCPSAVASDRRPSRQSGLPGRSGAASPKAPPGPGPRPTLPRRPAHDSAAVPATMPPRAVDRAAGDGARPHGTRLDPVMTAAPPYRGLPHRHHPADAGRDGGDRTDGQTPDGWTPDGWTPADRTAASGRGTQTTGHWTGWTPDGWTPGPRTAGWVGGHPNSGHRLAMDSRQASWHPDHCDEDLPLGCCPKAPPGRRRVGRSAIRTAQQEKILPGAGHRRARQLQVTLCRPVGASAHCCPRTISGRA
jgi:hypothetical protein